jgi:hypothetical protein
MDLTASMVGKKKKDPLLFMYNMQMMLVIRKLKSVRQSSLFVPSPLGP